MSHLRAEIRNPAAARGHLTAAVFGSPARASSFTDLAPPAGFVPLDMARSFRDPPPPGIEPFAPAPFWEQRLEGRGALGHAPREDYRPGRADRLSTVRGTGWTSLPSLRTGLSTRWP